MNMIDVHILISPERELWLDECLASLKRQPINLYLIDGIKNHVGRGRIKGFSQGNSEWVSFVDDDDLVLPGAFSEIEDTVRNFPTAKAIFTREEFINEKGEVIKKATQLPDRFNKPHLLSLRRWDHHLMVFKRKELEVFLRDLKGLPMGCNAYLARQFIKNYPCVMHPMVAYQWRMHNSNWHKFAVKTVGDIKWPG